MKKSFIIVGLLFVFAMANELSAQTKNLAVLSRAETMQELGLNSEQQQQILKLSKQSGADLRALKEDTSLSDSEGRKKRAAIYRTREAEYKKVLTSEQWEKYQEFRAAAKQENAKN